MSTIQRTTKNAWRTVVPKLPANLANELSSAHGQLLSPWLSLNQVHETVAPDPMPLEWEDPEYRQAAMESTVENMIAWGVRINREHRNLTQAQLAELIGTKQSAVSKLEDPDGGDVLLSKLMKTAHALDLALLVKFVDYAEFAAQTRDVRTEKLLAQNYEQAKSLCTSFAPNRKLTNDNS